MREREPVRYMMVTMVDLRRFRDGERALALPDPGEEASLIEREEYMRELYDARVALQSLGDYDEKTNREGWEMLRELDRRYERARRSS